MIVFSEMQQADGCLIPCFGLSELLLHPRGEQDKAGLHSTLGVAQILLGWLIEV